ncbi:MAG: ferrous iron transport protein B [Methanosarcinales archaeon]|nr:ferrous iron transport protein B [Methanosarcinales archaeon]
MKSCCDVKNTSSSNASLTIALVGNPNVGKSAFFTRLTGVGVEVSNYPGTTVEITKGTLKHEGESINVVDLPGIYSLSTSTEDERAAMRYLSHERPAVIINVIDATRLARNLNLTLQLLEIDIPMVVALNQVDAAEKMGIRIDVEALEEELGVPVIPTIAIRGKGIDTTLHRAIEVVLPLPIDLHFGRYRRRERRGVKYDDHVEMAIENMQGKMPDISRGICIRALEGDRDFIEGICEASDQVMEAATIPAFIEENRGLSIKDTIVKNRYGEAGTIEHTTQEKHMIPKNFMDRLDGVLTSNRWGLPIFVILMLFMFYIVFRVGGYLEVLIVDIFEMYLLTPAELALSGLHPLAVRAILFGLLGVEAGLAIVIPFIGTFYIFLALMEDSGYLPRAAFLLDRFMHRLGLHGRAIIPLLLGYGCNVPAIMAARTLNTRRERVITVAMIALTPCSARTVIIMGLVGAFVGFWAAISIYLIELVIILLTGWMLGKGLPGEQMGFIMEMPPLRTPGIRVMVKKTWLRMKGFVYVAFPILIVGSSILGVVDTLGLLDVFEEFSKPVFVEWMGLPAFAATAFIFGILRKEMALEILAVLAGTAVFIDVMTPLQIYVFALVATIYVPCAATIAVIGKELGWRDMVLISGFTIVLSIAVGGLANHLGMALL